MKKKMLLLTLALPFLLTGCGGIDGSNSPQSDSSSSASSSSDSSTPDESFSALGIYNRLGRISASMNYSFSSLNEKGKMDYTDVYTEKYILNNPDLMGYVLLDNAPTGTKGVYTVPIDKKDANGNYVLELGSAYATRNSLSGAVTGIEDNLRSFDYFRLFNDFKGQEGLIPKSAIRKKAGRKDVYVSTNEYLLAMLGYVTSYSRYFTSVSYKQVDFFYDNEENLGFYLYSKDEDDVDLDGANTDLYPADTTKSDFLNPISLEKDLHYCAGGLITNIGTSSNKDFEEFMENNPDCRISTTETPKKAEELLFQDAGYSCDTTYTFEYYQNKEPVRDFGTIAFDFTDTKMKRVMTSSTGKESVEIIGKDEMGYAYQEYLGGTNTAERITTDTPYEYFYQPNSGWDLNGFRKVEGKDYYLYYGADHYTLYKGLTQGPLSSSDFGIQRIEARVDSQGRFSSFKFVSTLGYYALDANTTLFGHFVFNTTILDTPRAIGTPTPLAADADTPAIADILSKITNGSVAIKTVASEAYNSTVSAVPVITSYYDDKVVYHERATTDSKKNVTKTGYGYFSTADGLVYFEASYDEAGAIYVEPKSAPMNETIKDHWVPLTTSPNALCYDEGRKALIAKDAVDFFAYSTPYIGNGYYTGANITPDQIGKAKYVLSADGSSIASFEYAFSYSNDVFGVYDAGSGHVDFSYGEEASLPEGLMDGLNAMGSFTNPTSWSESRSKNKSAILKMFNTFFEGTAISVSDIPYCYDPILDEKWSAYTSKNPEFASVWVGGYNGDGDVNGIFENYKALLLEKGFDHFIYSNYSNRKFDAYQKDGLYVVVNRDLTQGIYFYKSNPMEGN